MPLSVGIIGIIVAFVLMNYLVYKGLNVVLTATLVTFIIVLTSGLSIGEAWNAGMGGVGALLGILGPIIMFGAVLGMFYTKSGAAASLADALVKPFINAKNMKKQIIGCLAMIFILRIIIGLAGIDNMAIMYTMLAIAAGVFAKCGIPRKYLNVLLMVAGTCGTLVPGAPMSVLITIEQYIPGFRNSGSIVLRSILLIIYVVVAVVIMYSMIKRDMDRGETYDPGPLAFPDTSEQKVPHPLLTILPILAVYLLYNFAHFDAWLALVCGIVVAAVAFGAYIPKEEGKSRFSTIIDTANSGVFIVPIAILFSMLPGFIMQQSEAYNVLIDAMAAAPIPSALGFLLISILIVGLAGNAAVVLLGGIATAAFIPAGLSAQACGVILIYATVVLDSLPNNLGIITQCEIMDCKMKECYPSIFRTTVLLTAALSLVVALCAMIGLI